MNLTCNPSCRSVRSRYLQARIAPTIKIILVRLMVFTFDSYYCTRPLMRYSFYVNAQLLAI